MICFGLAPHFLSLLLQKLTDEVYVILFDETTNHKLQEKQLDFHIRFWNKETKLVKTHYVNSKFLGHATSDVLVECLNELLCENKMSKHLITCLNIL